MNKYALILLTLPMLASLAPRAESHEQAGAAFTGYRSLDAAELDNMRGGFSFTQDGARFDISFGIERVSFVNGQLAAATRINLDSLSKVTPGQASGLATLSPVQLIQNGPGNTFTLPATASPSYLTVIQNTLDNQTINNLTVINATVPALSLFRTMDMTSSVNQAVAASLR